jgi:hypothetical protein
MEVVIIVVLRVVVGVKWTRDRKVKRLVIRGLDSWMLVVGLLQSWLSGHSFQYKCI